VPQRWIAGASLDAPNINAHARLGREALLRPAVRGPQAANPPSKALATPLSRRGTGRSNQTRDSAVCRLSTNGPRLTKIPLHSCAHDTVSLSRRWCSSRWS
jgi:hypothetical protein